jgi:hypothetical protein
MIDAGYALEMREDWPNVIDVNPFPGKQLFQYAVSRETLIIWQAVSHPKIRLKGKAQARIT